MSDPIETVFNYALNGFWAAYTVWFIGRTLLGEERSARVVAFARQAAAVPFYASLVVGMLVALAAAACIEFITGEEVGL